VRSHLLLAYAEHAGPREYDECRATAHIWGGYIGQIGCGRRLAAVVLIRKRRTAFRLSRHAMWVIAVFVWVASLQSAPEHTVDRALIVTARIFRACTNTRNRASVRDIVSGCDEDSIRLRIQSSVRKPSASPDFERPPLLNFLGKCEENGVAWRV